jgi:aspartyl-tRNA(Asn)/glutamyl-tRNA(Gln) amidotransferase subunit A
MPYTHASVAFKDQIAEYDSTPVARLRGAGAVIVGLSTASEFGYVGYTSTPLNGTTRNPWDLERTPGGSSGGAAAAVAGGLVPIVTAGDGGGSIRIPASFTGMLGMKGTFGRIPRGPRTMFGQLTQVRGAVTRSVRDGARWYDVTSGADTRDSFSLPRIDGWEENLGKRELKALRVGVSMDIGTATVHPHIAQVVSEAAEFLVDAAAMRHVDVDVQLPQNGVAWARAGLVGLVADLEHVWPDCREALSWEIQQGMDFSVRYRARHGAAVDRFRMQMNEAIAELFEQVDVLLCPVAPIEPFKAEGPVPSRVGEERPGPFNFGAFTIPGNLSGIPGISIPCGLSPSGLPVGLQAYARRHEDALLFDLALVMELARPWPLTAPGAPV